MKYCQHTIYYLAVEVTHQRIRKSSITLIFSVCHRLGEGETGAGHHCHCLMHGESTHKLWLITGHKVGTWQERR